MSDAGSKLVLPPREGYDLWSSIYDDEDNPLIRLEEAEVMRALGDVRGMEAADLGCGTGRHALAMAAAGARVTALDFSEGIPAEHATMVAVPSLLLNERQVHELVMDLEIRYLANRDPHLHFALVTDSTDAEQPDDGLGDPLVPLAQSLVTALNERYGALGQTPFYLFHRHRVYNPSERRWMG